MNNIEKAITLLSGKTCDHCIYFGLRHLVISKDYCKLKSGKAIYLCPEEFTCDEWSAEVDIDKMREYMFGRRS